MLYFKDRQKELKEKNGCLNTPELTSKAAKEWSALPMENKQKYINESLKQQEKYKQEMKKYDESVSKLKADSRQKLTQSKRSSTERKKEKEKMTVEEHESISLGSESVN